jgi:hypothetical protein
MADDYEVLGHKPPPKKAWPVAKPKPADEDDGGGYGVIDEAPAKRPEAHLGYKRKLQGFEDDQVDVPVEMRVRKPDKPPPVDEDDKLVSRIVGVCVLVVGTGMAGGGWLASSSPGHALALVGGCGVGVVWLGLGLILFPVSPQALRAVRDHRHYDELFRVPPAAWKWWFWLCFVWLAVGFFLPRVFR